MRFGEVWEAVGDGTPTTRELLWSKRLRGRGHRGLIADDDSRYSIHHRNGRLFHEVVRSRAYSKSGSIHCGDGVRSRVDGSPWSSQCDNLTGVSHLRAGFCWSYAGSLEFCCTLSCEAGND